MQSTFHIISDSYNFPFSWRARKTHFTIQNPTLKTPPRPFPQTVTLSNSLKLSYNHYESEEVGPSTVAQPLPVAIHRPGVVSRYFWDGNCLKLVPMDGGNSSINFYREDGFGEMISLSSLAVRNFFIPERVNENYLDYVKWKFLHRVFSSALQVLATQAMFRAIGIGYSRSLPSAAALNWVLKDGLGRLCRCIYTACLASAFDTNLKRVRFSTSVLFSLSIGVEMLTPAFPQYFLLLASIANIAKQISLACYLATNAVCCTSKLRNSR